jgi:IclR family acetate operon transcriptional repressor
MGKSETVQSLRRGLALLDAMADGQGRGATLSELAERTGLSVSTAHRLLATLIEDGFAIRDRDSGFYVPGHRTAGIAASVERRTAYLRALVRPQLEKIAAETGETTNLVVLDDVRAVYLDQVPGARAVRMSSRVGSTFPAHSSGSAKAILAFQLDDALLNSLLAKAPFQRFTSETLTTPADLQADLERTRQRGYAIEAEEYESGAGCIAAPIRDARGAAIAAISLPGPVQRVLGADAARLGALILRHADEISRVLGYRPSEKPRRRETGSAAR